MLNSPLGILKPEVPGVGVEWYLHVATDGVEHLHSVFQRPEQPGRLEGI